MHWVIVRIHILLFFLIVAFIDTNNALRYQYQDKELKSLTLEWQSEYYYTANSKQSYIHLNLNLTREILLFNVKESIFHMFIFNQDYKYISTHLQQLYHQKACTIDELLYNRTEVNHIAYAFNGERLNISKVFYVPSKGTWGLYYLYCSTSLSNTYLNGEIVFSHDHGLLNSIDYPLTYVYFVFTVLYLIFIVTWIILCKLYHNNLLKFQKLFIVVPAIGFIYILLFSYKFIRENSNGIKDNTLFVLTLALEIIFYVICRIYLLFYFMGYGIITQNLSRAVIIVIIILCLVYVSCAVASSVLTVVLGSEGITSKIINFPYALINIIMICWFFISLKQTIDRLRTERQLSMLKKYQKTGFIFSLLVTVALLLSTLNPILSFYSVKDLYWKIWFLWDTFYVVFYFLVMVSVSIYWRPVYDNSIYGVNQTLVNNDQISREEIDISNNDGIQLESTLD